MFCKQNENKSPDDERGDFVRFAGAFLVIMITSVGGFYIWDTYFSEIGKARRFAEEQTAALEKAESAYIKAMTEDTYGGKTPQETLHLFVEALKAGDVDLASKYFLLKEEENFSRERWVNRLLNLKNQNLMGQVAGDISSNAVQLGNSINENDFSFGMYDDGILSVLIRMRFNKYSDIWKIESL